MVLGNVNGGAPGDIARKLASLAHGDTVKLQSERKEITLDPKVLARYVGAYQMAPGVNMLVTLENNQLFSKLGNQNAIPIFAESETMFFPKVVDAELEFTEERRTGQADRDDPPSEWPGSDGEAGGRRRVQTDRGCCCRRCEAIQGPNGDAGKRRRAAQDD